MARWDGRYRYDLTYHTDVGRLYGRLGMLDEPDYWAMIADTYAKAGDDDHACAVYRMHIPHPERTPIMPLRYASMLESVAVTNYNAGLPGLAAMRLREAQTLDPHNLVILYALGMSLTKTGDYAVRCRAGKR